MTSKRFEVGGCVRDELLGLASKDVDFVVIADSYEAMRADLVAEGFNIFQERPEFVTIRAGVPKDHPLRSRTRDADFVLARKDSATGDGRRPDFVEPGTLLDDLSRRDFTANAIACDPLTGEFHDPFHGREDILDKTLRFVGDPYQRIEEDGLRVLRGFRFMITKSFAPEYHTRMALTSDLAISMLASVSVERIREELEKMFSFNTLQTLTLMNAFMTREFREALFHDGLRLSATMKAGYTTKAPVVPTE